MAEGIRAGVAYVDVLPEMSGFATGVGKGINRIGNQLTRTGRVLTRGITIPVALAGAASVKMALDYENSIKRVASLTEASQQQVQKWSNQILELGPKLGAAPNDFAQALYFVASSGAKVADVMPIATAAVKASVAGMGDAQTVAQILTSAVNAYGSANLSAARAADILTEAVKVGKAEPAALATSLGRVIPLAQAMGVTFAETAASVSTLTNTGLSAAEATTAIRAVLTTLVKPADHTIEQYKKMGLSATFLRDSIRKDGLNATLVDLRKRIGDNQHALGELFPNVRALTGFLALTGQNAGQVARNVDLVTHSVGVAGKAFKTAAESDAFKFQKALAGLQATAVKLGIQILPFVTQLIGKISELVKSFESLSPEQQKIIAYTLLFAAAIGPVVTLLGNFTIILGGAIRALALVGQGMLMLAGATAATEAATAGATAQMVLFEASTVPVIGSLGLVALGLSAIIGIGLIAYFSAQSSAAYDFADSERDATGATRDLSSALEELKTGHIKLRQANLDRARAADQLAEDEKKQAKFVRQHGHESHVLAQQIEQDGINISSAEVQQAQAHVEVASAQNKRSKATKDLLKAQQKAGHVATMQAAQLIRRLNPALANSHDAASRLKQAMLVGTEAARRFAVEQTKVAGNLVKGSGAMDKAKRKAAAMSLAAADLALKLGHIPTAKQVRVYFAQNMQALINQVKGLNDEIYKLPTDKTVRIHVLTERALGGRAAGGPVSAGTPYLVGERGPELFVPHNSGNIVPNHALGGGGGRTRALIEIEGGPTLQGWISSIADESVARGSNLKRQKRRMQRS